ncbi:protein kinase [Streptomyces sp. NPDC005492]|uniref:serine/threonine-protein kinase n=1 Tax=Streptomyces sp. NPDC005492 TaxID=3156883 RepID=UPI0033B3E332
MEKLGAGDPQRIGAYRLLARLGAGGMGHVYLARSDRGRTVAVKLVREDLAAREEFRARFRQEVRAARRVGGYWTAPVLDADTEAEVPWVATGYVAGPSLQQVVGHDHGALPERSVRILAAGLAHALRDIHAAGIVHRDLKPSNVLVTIDGPRVIDFGIARALETVAGDGLTRTGSLVGSPGFMAPEQVRGDRVTPASDVFCLGSVLAYAATGTLPFGAANSGVHALMFRIAQEEPDLSAVPEGITDLIRACLRKDPAARPTLHNILDRTGAEDTLSDGRARDPWLPGALVAQLGRHAVRLLDTEDPETVGMERGALGAVGAGSGGLGSGGAGGVASGGGSGEGGSGSAGSESGGSGSGGLHKGGSGSGGSGGAGFGGAGTESGGSGSGGSDGGGSKSGGSDKSGSGSGGSDKSGSVSGGSEKVALEKGVPEAGDSEAQGAETTAGAADPETVGPEAASGGALVPGPGPGAGAKETSASAAVAVETPAETPVVEMPAVVERHPAPASEASPEHAPASDDSSPAPPAGAQADRVPTMVEGRPGTTNTPPPPTPHPAYGYPQQHPQPAADHGYPPQPAQPTADYGPPPQPAQLAPDYGNPPQPARQLVGWGGQVPYNPYPHNPGLGSTPPYGPGPYTEPGQEARRNGRSTMLLVVVALVVALGAGGSVYALMKGGGDSGRTTTGSGGGATSAAPTTPGPTTAEPSPTDSPSPTGEGAVPSGYLGTWNTSIDNSTGHNTRQLTIRQGKVGDPVLTLIADGPGYHCEFSADLAQQPGGESPLAIGPSTVTSGKPLSTCNPGAATEITLLSGSTLERVNTSSGEKLTYTKSG